MFAESEFPGGPLPDIRTQLEDELAALHRPAAHDGADAAAPSAAAADFAVPRALVAARAGPPMQAAFQPGACAPEEQHILQLNPVGRVVSKALHDGHMASVHFHDQAKHRKKMAPVRSAEAFALAALSDSGAALIRWFASIHALAKGAGLLQGGSLACRPRVVLRADPRERGGGALRAVRGAIEPGRLGAQAR